MGFKLLITAIVVFVTMINRYLKPADALLYDCLLIGWMAFSLFYKFKKQ